MKCKNEECPNCGNYVRGKYIPFKGRDLVTKGGKTLVTMGLDSVFPYLGTGIDCLFGDSIDESLNEFADEFDDSEKFAFDCPRCGHTWTSFGRPSMPDYIIEQVRNKHIETLRRKRPYISSIIFSGLSLYFTYGIYASYATASEANFMESIVGGFVILMCIVLLIISLIITIVKWRRISSLNKEINTCENQTLQEFYHSHKELFSEYKQYR